MYNPEKITELQEFNWGWYCRSGWCTDQGDIDPILPKRAGIWDPWKCYLPIQPDHHQTRKTETINQKLDKKYQYQIIFYHL